MGVSGPSCEKNAGTPFEIDRELFDLKINQEVPYIILSLSPQGISSVWSGDSLDWKDLAAGEITKRVTSKVCPGSIVLFHNAAKHTPEALPGIIEFLLQEGYTFVPISQIILPQPYTIDHTGRQLPGGDAC